MSNEAQIINAITGETVKTNMKFFMSLDEFKHFIGQKWNIPWEQLLILLPFGDKLKVSTFKECLRNSAVGGNEFHVYDRRIFSIVNEPLHQENHESGRPELNDRVEEVLKSISHDSQSKNEYTLFKPMSSPLQDADLKMEYLNHRTITSLLTTNLGWLSALEIDVHYFRELIRLYLSQTSSILKCLSICEQYLKLYCYDVEKLYNSNVRFLNQLANNSASHKWKECYNNVLAKLNGLNGFLKQYANKESLSEAEIKLKSLDQNINSKLKKVKLELDVNAGLRNKIGETIEILREEFAPESMKDHLEKMMLGKFDELVKDTRESSRDKLEQDFDEASSVALVNSQAYLENIKSGVTSKLFTIANAVYAQTESVLCRKCALQKKVILTFGQIAFVQMETLGIKKILLNSCNRDLDSYQKLELGFARVEDIPLIYGLYLIERYRRQLWVSQVISNLIYYSKELKGAGEKEKIIRSQWMQKFGVIASIFSDNLEDLSDFELWERSFGESLSFKTISGESAKSLEDAMHPTLHIIENYIAQIKELDIPKEIAEILSQSFSEANNYNVKPFLNNNKMVDSAAATASRQVDGYKARIKKLESLLHDANYSDPIHWPSGILDTTNMQPFHNNISTIGSKIAMNSSIVFESSGNNPSKLMEMQIKIQKLQQGIEQLNNEKQSKDSQLSAANSRMTDLEIEKTAFRESLTHLNNELSRLTKEEEERKEYVLSQQRDFKIEIQGIIQENKNLLQDLKSSSEKVCNVEGERNDLVLELKKLKEEFDKQKRIFDTKTEEFSHRDKRLEEDITALQKANDILTLEKEAQINNIDEATQTLQYLANGQSSAVNVTNELGKFSKKMEAEMFEIFKSDVFILENIGLLLAFDEEDRIEIKRVKGLKKGQNISILDDSMQIPENDTVLKSSVFRAIKQLYYELQDSTELKNHENFRIGLSRIYNEKLFQNAVIGRFKDIEFLAKKLTKENKRKKNLLESYQKQRLALNSFQIGDLALFLPTREAVASCESSESSLISSFSSVDLSTPPPFDTANVLTSPNGKKDKGSRTRKSPPWAAFTAFDGNTRYFLKDEDKLTKGREWFVGRVLNLESHVVNGQDHNPYKLPKGTIWHHITATMVSLSG